MVLQLAESVPLENARQMVHSASCVSDLAPFLPHLRSVPIGVNIALGDTGKSPEIDRANPGYSFRGTFCYLLCLSVGSWLVGVARNVAIAKPPLLEPVEYWSDRARQMPSLRLFRASQSVAR